MPETLIVERAEGIVTVTMNRPERKNAANDVMWNELLDTFREVAANPADRVLVITGAGGAFCSGADVGGMQNRGEGGDDDGPRAHSLDRMRFIAEVATALHQVPQPTIAKVRGIAAGAGMNIALLCDLVVASDNARFSEIFARRGLTLDFGGSWILPRRVGLHRAKELALFADIIDADEADRIGLVNRVVSDGELDAFVDDWAARLAGQAPIAIAQSKRLLNAASTSSLAEALDAEGAAQSINFTTRDTAEAVNAFLEKRQPTFRGY
ncbi:MAG: enoyl-CoA hydratase/isomerase family protein [Desertimonas sp.]